MKKTPQVGQFMRGWTAMDDKAAREGAAVLKLQGFAAKPQGKGKKVGSHRHRN